MRISWAGVFNTIALLFCAALFLGALPFFSEARNINRYSDTITDSKPEAFSNHTFTFTNAVAMPPSSVITVQFPADFYIATSADWFDARNVELVVNGTSRLRATTTSATEDAVSITRGYGGTITYTLASLSGIAANATLELKVGNRTTGTIGPSTSFSTSTGTTTNPGDLPPIQNSPSVGTHLIDLSVTGPSEPMYASFNIAVVHGVTAGVDTTETVPPYRFNPAPTSTVGGTTLSVEISLETDEFAWCRYSQASSTPFLSMTNVFENTGLIVHSTVVPVVRGELNRYYIRCIDDEGNFNTDDFLIAFVVNDQPTGTANNEGDVEGDGTGSGNDGTGDGSGTGGTTGNSNGTADSLGGTSGGGGSGGGSGGRSGTDSQGAVGGGFETNDGPYPSGDAEVIISGYAFPGSTVYAIVDGSAGGDTRAGSDGSYSITISQIARGAYTFGVYAEDRSGTKSSVFSTSFTVSGGRTSSLSNINVMPTVKASPDPVNPGQTLTLSGYSLPNATVTIENQRDGSSVSRKEFTATSDRNGAWEVEINTTNFSQGTYQARAKATGDGVTTNFSNYTYYGVGQEATGDINADLNTDGRVNLTDFSILLFWWGTAGGDSNPPADINRDGSVSLTDFSIMLFNWTG